MLQTDVEVLKGTLERHWSGQTGEKVERYIGQYP